MVAHIQIPVIKIIRVIVLRKNSCYLIKHILSPLRFLLGARVFFIA